MVELVGRALNSGAFVHMPNDPSSAILYIAVARLRLAYPSASETILVDMSSCSRSTIATVLLVLSAAIESRLQLTIAYALSEFDEPPNGELPSHISEPVVGDLAGWSDDLSKPPCAIIGLGFEPGRALGCIDYLEIPEVRLFMLLRNRCRFLAAVESANALLIEQARKENVLPYDVTEPSTTHQKLESLVRGLFPICRPVLIPLGPKFFCGALDPFGVEIESAILCVAYIIRRWRTREKSEGRGNDRYFHYRTQVG